MNHDVSSRVLDKTMAYILDHPNLSDDDLNQLASDPAARMALSVLKAAGAIDFKTAFGGDRLYNLQILNDGVLYFFKKSQERAGFWKGYIAGAVSAVISGIVVNLIAGFIMSI
jgi:hypothetical protein